MIFSLYIYLFIYLLSRVQNILEEDNHISATGYSPPLPQTHTHTHIHTHYTHTHTHTHTNLQFLFHHVYLTIKFNTRRLRVTCIQRFWYVERLFTNFVIFFIFAVQQTFLHTKQICFNVL